MPARYIETVPKRGYRFIAEVRNIEARTRETESAASEQPVAAQIGSQSVFTRTGTSFADESPPGNQIAYEYSESIDNTWLLELK